VARSTGYGLPSPFMRRTSPSKSLSGFLCGRPPSMPPLTLPARQRPGSGQANFVLRVGLRFSPGFPKYYRFVFLFPGLSETGLSSTAGSPPQTVPDVSFPSKENLFPLAYSRAGPSWPVSFFYVGGLDSRSDFPRRRFFSSDPLWRFFSSRFPAAASLCPGRLCSLLFITMRFFS